jgi:hypothetical protein
VITYSILLQQQKKMVIPGEIYRNDQAVKFTF